MKLSETVARLAALRKRPLPAAGSVADRLDDLTSFGSNPGNLGAKIYTPKDSSKRPLVVVLHGCTQTAAGYDHGAGWSHLADRHGFALLLPQQQRANNPNLCFNWFSPADNKREAGEALSIRQMIATMIADHDVDPARVFITGLSAGGAMTSVMLATYPELFAGGAIIAGLPYGSASDIPQALERMRGQGGPDERKLEALARDASPHRGAWPIVSIWHGDADATVAPINAEHILAQWRALHGVTAIAGEAETIDGQPRRRWRDATGRIVVEDYRIAGLGHGTPLATKAAESAGVAGAYMLEAGISSSHRILDFWGLTSERPAASGHTEKPAGEVPPAAGTMPVLRSVRPTRMPGPPPVAGQAASGVQQVIEQALRSAGLMR